MHQSILATLFAASALAAPSRHSARYGSCTTPGTYTCAADASTMEVCDHDLKLKPLVPGCPAGTACQPNPFGNNIPYCILKSTYAKRSSHARRNETGTTGGEDDSTTSVTLLPATTSSPGAGGEATGGAGEATGTEVVATETGSPAPTKTVGGGSDASATPFPKETGGYSSGGSCSTPNQFSCFTSGGKHGIRICDLSGHLQTVGYCAATEHCGYIGTIPYCLASWAP